MSTTLEMAQNCSLVFFITGCSSGFGRELAIAALASGFRVIATARTIETLKALEDLGAKSLSFDVNSPPDTLNELANKAIAIYGQVDYLVNNAGFTSGGAIEEHSPTEVLEQFNTNFFGLVNTTNAFLPHFRARGTGTLVNIGSVASTGGQPSAGIYAASKAAVDAVSDTWAKELAEYGIRSISVQPGNFRTEVLKPTNGRFAANKVDGYAMAHGVVEFLSKQYAGNEPGDPVKGAQNIITLVTKNGKLPLRLVLGDDAFPKLETFYKERLAELEATRELSTGTSFTQA
ncbi:Short-chain dehydrogenase/reductase family protein [Mycena venus]|uniref:Short-chain dehydrogenase/reductase family protein n=1 Tax=Mycena venus TaxID=2733690 RepID=A0A8H6XFQ5_9AGAR|nr:Short-chain dehydrogenase/reductase family protein [Mycena venus]